MRPLRYRDDDDSSSRGLIFLAAGAVAGVALGVWLAQRAGGFSALSSKVRERFGRADGQRGRAGASHGVAEDDEGEEDEVEEFDAAEAEELEERVLEAFRNDPIMSERAVDIGAIGEGIVELTGWVHDEGESEHATTLTRGVPGVTTVVNRLGLREEERARTRSARRYESGDPALTEARWEGQQVGTGRRRQGTSQEIDRHADPRTNLEERWMREQHAIEAAADDIDDIAERRNKADKGPREGDRTGGAPTAPTGVPKGDHVADPESEETQRILREQTGRDTRRGD